jgi:hypothetical protein
VLIDLKLYLVVCHFTLDSHGAGEKYDVPLVLVSGKKIDLIDLKLIIKSLKNEFKNC